MDRESPYSAYLFQRELTYAFLQSCLWYQYTLLGNPDGIKIDIQKGLWKDATNWLRSKFFGSINDRPEYTGGTISVDAGEMPESKFKYKKTQIEFPDGVIDRDNLEEEDQEIFDFINQNWNEVYEEYRDKSTLLGHLASILVGKGEKEEVVKDWNLEMVQEKLTKKYNLPGLDEVEQLMKETGFDRERVYQLIYAKSKGAEWLAVYDDNGQRSGKAYESITQMYREQIAEALVRGASVQDIKSLMIFPDDEILHKYGQDQYEAWVEEHLNRNWHRFAVTEAAINFENGKLLQGLAESEQGSPVYYKYVRQTTNKKSKHNPVTCDKCLEWANSETIARLFTSEGDFQESEYYGGEDNLDGEPVASVAIWPGKSNAERGGMGSWWVCTPAHPFCGCHWIRYEPNKQEQKFDELEDIFNRGARRNLKHQAIIDREYVKERDKYKGFLIQGIWEEKTCACEHPHYLDQEDSWLNKYIDNNLLSK
jgi:hypothetical protein